jgi:glycerol-3-phosphate dehydrogenase
LTVGRYDLIVIGAGINGAAVAREAALSGLKALLVEQGDIGAGTSAASTRLIHGGLRYLEHAEIGLVRESLHERERLLRLAPHLVTPLKLYLPIYRGGARKAWQIRAGLWVYDLLSAGKSVPGHRMLGRDELLEELPGLAATSLCGGAQYYDAQVAFPERLVLENVRDAVAHGAELRTYTRATRIIAVHGRARSIEWRRRDGTQGRADADTIVNASGPWVDRVVGDLATRKLIGGTKGSHVISTPFPGAPAHAVYAEAAGDARPFFVVPWNGLYLIGTTDERFADDPGEARASMAEYRYLIAAAERLFPSAAPLEPRVCYTQAGVRPLPQTSKSRTGAITRSHVIYEHRNAQGLYSVIGGKLTTHRALAEDLMRRLRRRSGVAEHSVSRDRPLPGALSDEESRNLRVELGAKLGAAQADRLWRIYGAQARAIAARARAELSMVVGPSSKVLVAELVHALEEEWATSLADVLLRRCMAGLEADRGLKVAPAAAEWLVRLGIWDKTRAEQELSEYRGHVRRFEPPAA